MLTSIMGMLINSFTSCANWLAQLMTRSGMLSVWLGGFAIWTVYRFLLVPLFGVASSDTAKRVWRSARVASKAAEKNSGSVKS